MTTIKTLRRFERCNFTVDVKAVEDFDLDLSFDETGEVRKQLESGELCSFGVIVTVYCKGQEVGEDSLWGCIYKRPEDFMDHHGLAAKSRKDGCNYGSYFVDMIRSAIAEARKNLSALNAVRVRV